MDINHEQILLDWINTFDEPRCLISSKIEELNDCLVISDITKCILKAKAKNINFEKDFATIESSFIVKEKINIILNVLSNFYDKNRLAMFRDIDKSRTKLVEFLNFLKEMSENQDNKRFEINKCDMTSKEKIFQEIKSNNISRNSEIISRSHNNFITSFNDINNNSKKTLHRSLNKITIETKISFRDYDKIYTKKECLGLKIILGKPYIKDINLFCHKINFLSYLRCTNPVLGVGFDNPSYNKFIFGQNPINNQKSNSIKVQDSELLSSPDHVIDINEKYNFRHSRNYNVSLDKKNRLSSSTHIKNSTECLNLGHSLLKIGKEDSIRNWLNTLGIIYKSNEYLELFDSDVFLPELINRLEGGKQDVIKGIVKKNINPSQKLINLTNTLNFLKSKERFNKRHLWDTSKILNRDKKTCFELLVDIYDYYQVDKSYSQSSLLSKSCKISIDQIVDVKQDKEMFKSYQDEISSNGNNAYINNENICDKLSESAFFLTLDRSMMPKFEEISKKICDKSSKLKENQVKIANFMKYYNKRCNSSFRLNSGSNNFMSTETIRTPIGMNDDSRNSIQFSKENEEINHWLCKLNVSIPKKIDFTKSKLEEFKDGYYSINKRLLLISILEVFERTIIKGINYKPSSKIMCFSNIKKALSILRNRKNFPMELMCNEEEIYKGNASVIRNLLIHIKYAYREDLLTIKCNEKQNNKLIIF